MNENIKVIELKKNNIIINSLKRALKNSFQKEHIDPEYIDINLYDKIYICYSGGQSSIRKKTFTPTTILGFALITDITKYRNSSTHFIDLITNINQINKKIGLLLLNTLEKNCKNVELLYNVYDLSVHNRHSLIRSQVCGVNYFLIMRFQFLQFSAVYVH